MKVKDEEEKQLLWRTKNILGCFAVQIDQGGIHTRVS